MKTYRLAEYEITERYGQIWWKAHAGFGATRTGKCFIEGNILFLDPHCEADEASFLKNEFLQYLRKLPKWDRTKYYCSRFELHECGTASTPRKHRPPRTVTPPHEKPLHADVKPADADDKLCNFEQLQDDFDNYLQNQASSLSALGRTVAKGFESVKSGLKRVKFWR